jgi:hypothetical protein
MATREPETAKAKALRLQMSAARWEASVSEADRRVSIIEKVQARRDETGESWKKCLKTVAQDTMWSKYLHWRRRYMNGAGPGWERLLDRRVPPTRRVSEDVARAARTLRRADRRINCDAARELLGAEFGHDLSVSDTWLRRLWAASDLRYVRKHDAGRVGEEVEELHGGAGLALIAAADAETGSSMLFARAVLAAGTDRGRRQQAVTPRDEGEEVRDDRGRFTAGYNAQWRKDHAPGERDARWTSDATKGQTRVLADMPMLAHRPETLARKLLCMGAAALVTERRGFDGLDGPSGAWLGALGGPAYMPATLDKALAQLGLLDVDAALWGAHARVWTEQSRRWSADGPKWAQTAIYIDSTSDPYWTRQFARSGKVDRVGRVMPSLSRVAIASAAGVPLLVETHVGTVGLKKRIGPLLNRLDDILGSGGDVSRLTIVDSEAGTAGAMWALHNTSERVFITVLKGQVQKGARIYNEGPWMPYRERDEIREVAIDLDGRGAPEGGLTARGVEMRRTSRRPMTTLFATNAAEADLDAAGIVDAYLARWPNVEQLFRDTRHGIGLNRSHGYGGGDVAHVALETNLERAARRVVHAEVAQARAVATRAELGAATTKLDASARSKALALADKAVKQANAKVVDQHAKKAALETTPRTIYQRDTVRDSVMTCLKLNLCMLIEFVLREYFGGLGLEWRTFIEQFVALPVVVRTTKTRRRFQINANPRQPENMARLAEAIREINARKIRQDGRLLVFELYRLPDKGS